MTGLIEETVAAVLKHSGSSHLDDFLIALAQRSLRRISFTRHVGLIRSVFVLPLFWTLTNKTGCN